MAWTGFFGLSRKKTFILALIIGGVISGIIVAVIVITEATEGEDTNSNSGSNYYNQQAKITTDPIDQIEPYHEELIDRISCQAGYQALNGKCYQVPRNGRQDCGRSFVSDSVFFRAAAQYDVQNLSRE